MSELKFLNTGDEYTPIPKSANVCHLLPVGNYTIKHRQMGPPFLSKIAGMNVPKDIYGNTVNLANRIYNYFHDHTSNVGVLLEGERGSGKTLLSKIISNLAAKDGYPTVLVNDPETGPSFGEILQQIPSSVIIF